MIEPLAPETPCLATEVRSVDEETGAASVRFQNPAHLGGPLTVKTRQIPNPDYVEGGDEPELIEETYEEDDDPNPHVIKSVRVPLTEDGQIDQRAWLERLSEQARGVKARMTAAMPTTPAPGALDGLVSTVE